ncbi:MAG TPA: sigma-70 family RNA polymerase sigma factor [Bryobacteraceae bacterium]|jgi:RNA polymerase sigma-70 factor (ECF subfamily)|nr:sigma-70 family RNA polymerase sigma factor [Bryobacteraceae bacterium]
METMRNAASPALTGIGSVASPVKEDYAYWARVVQQIQCGETDGMEELYKVFPRIRGYYCRNIGIQECRDRVHDAFLIVVQAILAGQLREPRRLMGFVRTISQRQKAASIHQMVHTRATHMELGPDFSLEGGPENPEQEAVSRQRLKVIDQVLTTLSEREREILTRFYLHEETQVEICAAMSLTQTQFRLMKSRAKAQFGRIGKSRFVRLPLGKFH